jgi:hypothetical protein
MKTLLVAVMWDGKIRRDGALARKRRRNDEKRLREDEPIDAHMRVGRAVERTESSEDTLCLHARRTERCVQRVAAAVRQK